MRARFGTADDLFTIAVSLMRRPDSRDQMAGIKLYESKLIEKRHDKWRHDLHVFSRLFDDGLIRTWSLTDAFCIRILGKLITRHGNACALEISRWHTSRNTWKRRASLVSFVNLVQNDKTLRILAVKSAIRLIRSRERNHQTAVGWVMRELGRSKPRDLERFVRANLPHFSHEGLSRALEAMPAGKRKTFRALRGLADEALPGESGRNRR